MSVQDASKRILETLRSWDGIEIHPHRFGGSEFRIGRREIGHIHGDYLVDIPFPTKIRDEIVSSGQAEPHHVLPDSGWVSFFIREGDDVQRGIDLLHRSYLIAREQLSRRKS